MLSQHGSSSRYGGGCDRYEPQLMNSSALSLGDIHSSSIDSNVGASPTIEAGSSRMSTPRTVPRTHPLLKSSPEEAMRKSFERLPIFKIGATVLEQSSRMNGSPVPEMKLEDEDDRAQHSIEQVSIVTEAQSRETMRTRWRGSTLKRQPKRFRSSLGKRTLLGIVLSSLSLDITIDGLDVHSQFTTAIRWKTKGHQFQPNPASKNSRTACST